MGRFCVGVLLGVASWLDNGSAAAQSLGSAPDTTLAKPLQLGLHARLTRASARTEHAAWLTLAVPLESLAQPRLAAAPPPAPAPAAPAPIARADSPSRAAGPKLGLAQLRALGAFAQKAKAAALGAAGAASERHRLDSLSTRARLSAALPELRLRAQRSTDQALRWAPTADDPYRVTQADGAGTTLEASVTFQLNGTLFTRDELAIERLRADAAADRAKLEARVLEALWGLLRSRELSCVPTIDDDERALQLAHLAEHFGALDDLTAGWFSARAQELGVQVWGFPEAVSGVCVPQVEPSAGVPTNSVASLEHSE